MTGTRVSLRDFFVSPVRWKHLAKPNGKVFSKSVIGTSERNTEDVLSETLRRTEKHVVAQSDAWG